MKRSFLACALATLAALAACSDGSSTVREDARPPAFRGVYSAESAGPVGDLAVTDDSTYVLRASDCHSVDCLESGIAVFDAHAKTLTLGAHTFRVEIAANTKLTETKLTTRDLIDRDAGLVDDAGAPLTEVVTEATLDGQSVRLVVGQATLTDGGNGNATTPPWPGSIPGTGPLRSPADGETTTVHPGGNSVTVARPGDAPFVEDPELAEQYALRANIYNSHGMPGILYGGIPEAQVRRFLNDSNDPLIVAACFSGMAMNGGSTIRRLVSAYASDPASASRVYGCTGWTMASTSYGFACTGAWVDANQQAVPLVERQRLGLIQLRCGSNTIVDHRPSWTDCQDPH